MRLTSLLAGMASFVVLAALLAGPGGRSATAEEPRLAGDLPTAGGIALAVWDGGSAEELALQARAGGCNLVSVWTNAPRGGLAGYFPGALAAVNASFEQDYPGAVLPASSPVFLVCRPGGTIALSPPVERSRLSANITLTALPTVPPADFALIEDGVVAADAYLHEVFGRSVEGAVRVNVVLTSTYDSCCYALDGTATLATAAPDWQWAQSSVANLGFEIRTMVAAHEFVHLFQFEAGCAGTAQPDSLWLLEGMAEWVGHHAVHDADVLDGVVRDYREWVAANGPDLEATLAQREAMLPPDANYSIYYLAIDQLVQRSSASALGDFCVSVGNGTPWRSAFASAFGVTVDAFYADFAVYRQGLAQ